MWEFHDRLEPHISEQTCRAEIDSFTAHGQIVAVLGRPLRGDPDYEVELITGARRLFVAKHLNQPIAVELRILNDKEALIAMDTENRLRRDISPYERALSYARWIHCGHFKSQDEIARALKISSSQVSRVLRLAQLPTAIVRAFDNPTQLRENWASRLLDRLEDPAARHSLLETARCLSAQPERVPAKEVYRRLLSASSKGRKLAPRYHDVVVRDDKGAPLFRIRHQRDSIALLLPLDAVAEHTLRQITTAVSELLQAANAQVADSTTDRRSKAPIASRPRLSEPV